ncbi:MAG: chemotaxis protein CheW [Treponema sp.]|jgi:purine-binding chemotaxis protein CheW|nr:chemotaxis protein CheW [Treponema sp.]
MPDMTESSNGTAISHENSEDEKQLIFSLMNRFYSFPSHYIGEIALFDTVYPLPLMPPYILGVINRYSIPYALFDIGLLFHNTPSPRGKVLIIKDDIDRIAFLIDDVMGITGIQQEKLLNVERNAGSNDLTEAVQSSFSWNGSDVFILDIKKILSHVKEDIGPQ